MSAVCHLGFSKVENFNFRSRSEAQYASPCQISRRSVKTFRRYGRFSTFKDGGRRHFGFLKFQIFHSWDAQDCVCMPNFAEIALTAAEIWRFFYFSRWRPSAILDFQKLEISTSGHIRRPNMRHRTKFREDRSNRSGDMADFRLFKMAAAAILDFGNFEFLTVGTLKSVELRLHAKFRMTVPTWD